VNIKCQLLKAFTLRHSIALEVYTLLVFVCLCVCVPATPADVSLLMQLGVDGVFVGSGIFKSTDPKKRAVAMVQAVTHYQDPVILAKVSEDLGEPMVRGHRFGHSCWDMVKGGHVGFVVINTCFCVFRWASTVKGCQRDGLTERVLIPWQINDRQTDNLINNTSFSIVKLGAHVSMLLINIT